MLMAAFNAACALGTGGWSRPFAGRVEPMVIHYRVNAGSSRAGTGSTIRSRAAGRVLGEACHFIDLMAYLTAALSAGLPAVMGQRGALSRRQPECHAVICRWFGRQT